MDDVTTAELSGRLGEQGLLLLDVRSEGEYTGAMGSPCDPRQGHIPGARHLDVTVLLGASSVEALRRLVAAEEGCEIIAYCHSGTRSAHAVAALRQAGYAARNYRGSWHEWSRDPTLPIEPVTADREAG
ncbi:MAG: rhodanese-like domain-containing protein [Gaiellales bacterium]